LLLLLLVLHNVKGGAGVP